jgi:hypothetical protein
MLTFAALLFAVGLVDDIVETRPQLKLGWQVVIFLAIRGTSEDIWR